MKLTRPIFPNIPRPTKEYALKMILLLFARDEEIQSVINSNQQQSASRIRSVMGI